MLKKARNTDLGSYTSINQSGTTLIGSAAVNRVSSLQGILTESHRGRRSRVKHPWSGEVAQDNGGPFDNSKTVITDQDWTPEWSRFESGSIRKYRTLTIPMAHPELAGIANTLGKSSGVTQDVMYSNAVQAGPPPLDFTTLMASGSTAVSRCLPTNPLVNLSTSIAELIGARKIFDLPGKQLREGNPAGEYLNYQLGIAPVVSDVRDTFMAAKSAEAVLKQYERDSGRLIRRQYEFPLVEDSTTEQTVDYPGFLGLSLNATQVSRGIRTKTTTVSARTWFKGAFTYYLPKAGWRKSLAEYERLYGTTPGGETLWNVIPMSFVADYFANAGDVLHNVDRFMRDGLIMPYGYIMHEQTVRTTYDWRGTIFSDGNVPVSRHLKATVVRRSQQRRPANPFGFGLNEQDLTARQVSILAALGLSRR